LAENRSSILEKLKLQPKGYALATIHRPENTDESGRLRSIFYALEQIAQDTLPVIVPLHPRTRSKAESLKLSLNGVQFTDPVSYLDMLLLEKQAQVILTDSGGVQKEAYWFGVPCVTLRNETEWVETVESGRNVLVGSDPNHIINAVKGAQLGSRVQDAYGNGRGAEQIVHLLSSV
jgi:UDP-GlcNAc3NAcA epimerase